MIQASPTLQNAFEFAQQFAGALIDTDYSQARALLAESERRKWGLAELTHAWVKMVEDTATASMMPEIIAVDSMDGWPARQPDDVAWVYVPIVSELVNEAVSGIVVSTPAGLRLRALEFGRP